METVKPKILLCEDDTNLGMVLKNYLELNDYDVTLERDGRLGLAAFQREKLDICLLDVMMPNMDGIEFLRRAKLVTSAKVIIISSVARIDSKEAREVLELGAADIIPKPSGVLSIDFEEQKSLELLDAIHKCL